MSTKNKMKYFNAILFVTLFSCGFSKSIYAQETQQLSMYTKDVDETAFLLGSYKFGYQNSDGEIVVPPIYTYRADTQYLYNVELFMLYHHRIGEFYDGMALVYMEGKGFGFIDNTGREIVPCQYRCALAFSDGLAAVQNDSEKWGYINRNGDMVIPCKYDFVHMFSEERAFVAEKTDAGKFLVSFIDKSGKKLYSTHANSPTHGYSFCLGGAAPMSNSSGKSGYIGKEGNIVIPFEYDAAYPITDGIAIVSKNRKWGGVDKNNKLVIPFIYSNIRRFYGGFAVAEKGNGLNKREGLLKSDGKVVIPFVYSGMRTSEQDVVIAQDCQTKKWGIISKTNKHLSEFEYDKIYSTFICGLVPAQKDGKWGYLNLNGENVIPCVYEENRNFSEVDNLAYVKRGGLWALIDVNGNIQSSWYRADDSNIYSQRKKIAEKILQSDVDLNLPICPTKNSNLFAVIFANEDYTETQIGKVQFAQRDGEIFKKYCCDVMGIPEDNIHFQKNATLTQMRSHLNWLSRVSEGYNGDCQFIIYFAGHGIPDENTKDASLLPADGVLSDKSSMFSLKEFYDLIGKMKTKSSIVFLDACFSGAQRNGKMLIPSRGVVIKPKPEIPKANVVVLSATKGDETAMPYAKQGHGLFTYYLLKKLQETKGECSLGELYDYLNDNVSKQSILVNGKSQTPIISVSETLSNTWRNIKFK